MMPGRTIVIIGATSGLGRRAAQLLAAGGHLCVPKTLSTLCDQAVFVDEAAGVSPSPDTVPLEIDWFR